MFWQNARSVDMPFGSYSRCATRGLLNDDADANRFTLRIKDQQDARWIEAVQPGHWPVTGPRPVMSPTIAIALHGFHHDRPILNVCITANRVTDRPARFFNLIAQLSFEQPIGTGRLEVVLQQESVRCSV